MQKIKDILIDTIIQYTSEFTRQELETIEVGALALMIELMGID